MAGDGSTSGNGKTSPFGPADGGSPAKGNDFLKNPTGTSGGAGGNNFFENPTGSGDASKGNNFFEKPTGDVMAQTEQKNGTNRNETSIPAGGLLPYVKGGAAPSPTRTPPKSGFAAGSAPDGPNRKPFKVGSR